MWCVRFRNYHLLPPPGLISKIPFLQLHQPVSLVKALHFRFDHLHQLVRRRVSRPPLGGMIQIFWPGDDGLFPWEPDSTDEFRDQPRLDVSWKKASP